MEDTDATYPAMAFVAFQAVFAIITVALISGAIADRAKFGTWLIFSGIWATVVYFPIAHWVFDFTLTDDDGVVTHVGGWIANNLKAIDFAGGTAVHINAGAAGLALALVLGKRIGWKKDPMRPHNLTLVMLGAGLLWFGWFGFNAGSARLRRQHRRRRLREHHGRHRRRRRWPGCSRRRSATGTPPRWVRPPASSPAWSRSPRPAPR